MSGELSCRAVRIPPRGLDNCRGVHNGRYCTASRPCCDLRVVLLHPAEVLGFWQAYNLVSAQEGGFVPPFRLRPGLGRVPSRELKIRGPP
ncbi:hypothetical protein N7510_008766 [Penicillium lagena]|uniref:uncharacterized protein n=1 Tax=Penicillium lagena TaxID=94218 RepID=UPI002541C20C|nr:uncharacterized protein N7510_008766 [Penicillium lagena]KAJ5605985.1 hypothetical protein N7510_008766 [Penicillium lagena]